MSGTVTLDGLTTTPQTVNENEWYSLADFLSYQLYESSPGLVPPGTTLLYAGGTFVDPSENLANNYWATGIANLIYPSSAYQEITYANGTILRYIYVDDPSFPEPSPGLGISETSLDSIKIEFIAPGTTSIGAILGNNLRWYNTLQVPSYAPGIVPPEEVSAGDVTTNLYAPITVLANSNPPSITAQTPSVVENGQTTVIGIVTPGASGDTLTLTETGGIGTLSLGPVQADGSQQVIYTAPTSIAASATDSVSYQVSDQQAGTSASGTADVQLDAGPSVTAQTPSSVQIGQSTVIGTVTPGLPGDTLTLTQTAGTGTLSLGPAQADGTQQVIYTTPAAINANAVDAISYMIADQHNDLVASGSATVQLSAGASVSLTTFQKLMGALQAIEPNSLSQAIANYQTSGNLQQLIADLGAMVTPSFLGALSRGISVVNTIGIGLLDPGVAQGVGALYNSYTNPNPDVQGLWNGNEVKVLNEVLNELDQQGIPSLAFPTQQTGTISTYNVPDTTGQPATFSAPIGGFPLFGVMGPHA